MAAAGSETGGASGGKRESPGLIQPADWLVMAGLCGVYAPAILAMSEVWSRYDYYSHGYLVPLVALWAASGQRAVLPTLPVRREPRALLVLGLALLVYLVGIAASIVSLQGLSFVVAVGAVVTLLKGVAWLRALLFPISYLIFMVPIPDPLLTPMITRLQMWVSLAGIGVLRFFNVPVYREGNVFELPGGDELFVAEACSGITSVVTLIPLAVFLAYFTERLLWRRMLLVLAVLPLAFAGNLLRVLITVLVAGRWGSEVAAKGAAHEWTGIATYILGCLALLGVRAAMQWLVPERVASQTA
ncbi:MAG: exosortase/archaeosortase family protein [Deltaproteobacteria bacterium]|nr:exosortase/archaeosortase family protein [Deltaproteobacteria bacterium]MBW2419892.1 exosortase/archaeosortase family protein [Deltaproteobacteria bacterium]